MREIPCTCIVIPCYNEEKGLPLNEYLTFLDTTPEAIICFVNDGSTDKTLQVLTLLQQKCSEKVHIVSLLKNSGKAEAVRIGINYCNQNFHHQFIGYLDADLATSLEEFMDLTAYLKEDVVFCFGSRIRKIGSEIVRENSRFLLGRVIATFISQVLGLKVYDTQCGCKVFTKVVSELLFKEEFLSKWLFDVELFFRMMVLFGKEKAIRKMHEAPLNSWVEKGNSKVKPTYFFKLWTDLYQINKKYKNLLQNSSI
ncbi:glycosyltransferase [Flavobacterium frigoris]|uniref:Glycosyltransferase involved in cell wall bisynthesis n=1 Tax=Flavobacterium frigoris TaxID=229204 RepID=A0A1H9P5C8_FLAFI|nr:glycosyltransferase [Flavobacterium frigoris]SER43095.1 Glycosyltransferase involved in cell wall bisynthesis [Flavobacterium frigoris]